MTDPIVQIREAIAAVRKDLTPEQDLALLTALTSDDAARWNAAIQDYRQDHSDRMWKVVEGAQ